MYVVCINKRYVRITEVRYETWIQLVYFSYRTGYGRSVCIEWDSHVVYIGRGYGPVLYQMLLTLLTGATGHYVEPPVTSGKSQEEEKYDCPCRCGNNMGPCLSRTALGRVNTVCIGRVRYIYIVCIQYIGKDGNTATQCALGLVSIFVVCIR